MGKLAGSKSVRNRKWLNRIAILATVLVLGWLAVMAVQNWTSSQKDEADCLKKSPTRMLRFFQWGIVLQQLLVTNCIEF